MSTINFESAEQLLKEYVQKFRVFITEQSPQEEVQKIGYRYLSLAHLVPMMHLQFEGAQRMHRNCSVVAVWQEVYDCLIDVDETIFRLPVDVSIEINI